MNTPTDRPLHRLLTAALLAVPAYVVMFVSEVESVWTKRYGSAGEATSVRAARQWSMMCCLFYSTAILLVWAATKSVAPHYVRLAERLDIESSLPNGTVWMIDFARWGWLSL